MFVLVGGHEYEGYAVLGVYASVEDVQAAYRAFVAGQSYQEYDYYQYREYQVGAAADDEYFDGWVGLE